MQLGRKSLAWLDIAGFPLPDPNSYNDYPDVTLNIWTGCYSGNWQDDAAQLVKQHASVIVSGPFYITQQNGAPNTPHFTWQVGGLLPVTTFDRAVAHAFAIHTRRHHCPSIPLQQMYSTDIWNFTGSNATGAKERVQGGELCAWDDAAQADAGDILVSITPYILGVAEAFWSPQSVTSGHAPDENRAHVQRCRMVQRGQASHPIHPSATLCPFEYEAPVGLG